jgi:hypothetical protein
VPNREECGNYRVPRLEGCTDVPHPAGYAPFLSSPLFLAGTERRLPSAFPGGPPALP